MNPLNKILTWLRVNGATILGIIQAFLKGFKEVITGLINLISLLIPAETAQSIVENFRQGFNIVDGWVENFKAYLVSVVY